MRPRAPVSENRLDAFGVHVRKRLEPCVHVGFHLLPRAEQLRRHDVLKGEIIGQQAGERRRVMLVPGRHSAVVDLLYFAVDPRLPDDTRLWAALQDASGGAWGGSVFDVDAILRVLDAGRKALGS